MIAAIGYIVLLIGSIVLNGFAFQVLWGWFMVETFGLKPLTIPAALGLSLVVSFLTSHYTGEDKRSMGVKIATIIVTPLFFLLIGFIYHLFM